MSPKTIVVLDDDPAHRLLVCRALKKLPFKVEVRESSTLEEARALVASTPTALLLSDLNIGGVFAFPLITMLRTSGDLAHVPVIILSTSLVDSDVFECYQRGANCYLQKAHDPRQFQREVLSAVTYFLALEQEGHG